MPAATEVVSKYEAVIGLEVHVQLLTRSKVFCACSTRFGDPPNSNTCPVCLGLPGALPVLNREAVTMAMKAAMALNCTINSRSRFARKNYFYPDLPKGYQISQFDEPLSEHGWIDIDVEGKQKRIGITRVHLEEDAGKSLHEGFPDSDRKSYIDLNRTGVPLIETVSEPDLRTPEEAYDYLTRLKTIMLYLEVSDCNMEEGSLRVDANVSVRLAGAPAFGTKTEVKNLNSFRFLQKALAYEIERQVAVLEQGGKITQETRLYDSREGRTYGMRSKEFAHDYRYFPEPDLLPLVITDAWRDDVRRSLPELPEARKERLIRQYGVTADAVLEKNVASSVTADAALATGGTTEEGSVTADATLTKNDAAQLTASKALATYFEDVVKASGQPKLAANWVLSELTYLLKESGKEIEQSPVSSESLAGLLALIEQGTVSGKMGKEILAAMYSSGRTAREVMAAQGLEQINDAEKIAAVAREIIAANPKQVEQYRNGKTTTLGWFTGQVMKATRGQANPQLVQGVLKKELG